MNTTQQSHDVLTRLGVFDDPCVVAPEQARDDGVLTVTNPATDAVLAGVRLADRRALDATIERARAVQGAWQMLPAPKRGELIRRIGLAYRTHQEDLGALISLEMGKIRAEGVGEVIECVDIADFAVGLSRQLYGLTMHSERPRHRMYEQWHPLGTIGIITAFNFPMAVWAWNAMIAAACGNTMVWKPSGITPLCAVAMNGITRRVMQEQDVFQPATGDAVDVFGLIIGTDDEVGEPMIADRRLPLISATGSSRMGRRVGAVVAGRLGRTLLELGGNSALIVMPDADRDLVLRAVLFGAVGTAGQRCTSTRRLLVHEDIAEELVTDLARAYASVSIGDPLDEGVLMGPLIDARAVGTMRAALVTAQASGCEVVAGGIEALDARQQDAGHFVAPTIVRVPDGVTPDIVREETFAPILYVQTFTTLEDAIALQNEVTQGLSSAIFTDSVRAGERFLSHAGSDCGIANINIGTSGAEIGGAFGGEKDTGGGRESGSDSWKAYMRRQTCTINWGNDLPLAQGIQFS